MQSSIVRSFGGGGVSTCRSPALFAKHTHQLGPLTDKEAKCICLLVAPLISISGAIRHWVVTKNVGGPSSEFGMGGGCGYEL